MLLAIVFLVPSMTLDLSAGGAAGVGAGPWQTSLIYPSLNVTADADLELDWFYVGASVEAVAIADLGLHTAPLLTAGIGPHAGAIIGVDDDLRLLFDLGGYVAPVPGFLAGIGFPLPAGQLRGRGEWRDRHGVGIDVGGQLTLTFTASGTVILVPALLGAFSWRFDL